MCGILLRVQKIKNRLKLSHGFKNLPGPDDRLVRGQECVLRVTRPENNVSKLLRVLFCVTGSVKKVRVGASGEDFFWGEATDPQAREETNNCLGGCER